MLYIHVILFSLKDKFSHRHLQNNIPKCEPEKPAVGWNIYDCKLRLWEFVLTVTATAYNLIQKKILYIVMIMTPKRINACNFFT